MAVGTILLVRHGQASTGATDYDVLSPLGRRQAAEVGMELHRRGVTPAQLTSGTLRRQRDTAEIAAQTMGAQYRVASMPGWNEFDHGMLAPPSGRATPTGERAHLDHAIPRWSSGAHDDEYAEPFPDFTRRVEHALRELAETAGGGQSAVVVTSAGVIAWVATTLMGAGEQQWQSLNRVVINSSITKLSVGRRGITLLTFNEHAHLDGTVATYS